MLFKSLQSIVSSSSSSKVQIENQTSFVMQSTNKVTLLDNLSILNGNKGNNLNVLGKLVDN
ncbi:hypothetical protein RB653_005600 [Dictyostelium firmibasis]|uniref:Uncharacterized protein n=1 Tax=Dictyostelium firmibasis TaxID=79012 RepID=A0AAN7UBS2_9MYCE